MNFLKLLDKFKAADMGTIIYEKVKPKSTSMYLNSIQSDTHFIKIYNVVWGYEIPIGVIELIKDCAVGDVVIDVLDISTPHFINWGDPDLELKIELLKKQIDKSSESGTDEFSFRSKFQKNFNEVWARDTLGYLNEAELKRKASLWLNGMMVFVKVPKSAFNRGSYDKTLRNLNILGNGIGCTFRDLKDNYPIIMDSLLPFNFKNYLNPFWFTFKKKAPLNNLDRSVFTDELLMRFNEYKEGAVGKRGIYCGTDFAGRSVLKEFKRKLDDAENILIVADTGAGKGNLAKAIIYQLSAMYPGLIVDFEGNEYYPFGRLISSSDPDEVVVLSFAEGNYYDAMPLPLAQLIGDDSGDVFLNAKTLTKAVFGVLTNSSASVTMTWGNSIIETAISKTYTNYSVSEDSRTWINSQGMRYKNVYETLLTFRDIDNLPEFAQIAGSYASFKEELEVLILNLGQYFDPMGSKTNYFINSYTSEEVCKARLAIISFGMENKSEALIDKVHLALMQVSTAAVKFVRGTYSKYVLKTANYTVWEEVNRYEDLDSSGSILNGAMTGGRKVGDINVVITNKVVSLLPDISGNYAKQHFSGLMDQMGTVFIGAIGTESVRERLLKELGLMRMKPKMDLVAHEYKKMLKEKMTGGKSVDSPYRYAFLAGIDRSEYTLMKVKLPDQLQKSKLFFTGVIKDEVEAEKK